MLIKWTTDISIHAPHAGSDTSSTDFWTFAVLFQSTLPMRGATRQVQTSGHLQFYFNPRSPCGERQVKRWCFSMGGSISIHAPHAGSDDSAISRATELNNFNPRSPCGERRGILLWGWLPPEFQSTLPMRGATGCKTRTAWSYPISIHAPHAGSDLFEGYMRRVDRISIHAPHAGSDAYPCLCISRCWISIHAPHAGSDTIAIITVPVYFPISIHAPHAGSDI